jgi:thiol-disulfide isomerase/thioredoxin
MKENPFTNLIFKRWHAAMKTTILLFLIISCLKSIASDFQISISGNFPGAEGQTIRLMEYTDQISYNEQEIEAAIADESGNFEISFSRFETQYVFFRIDHARMGMFVEPGTSYKLQFEPVDFARLDDSRNPYLDPWYFHFSIIEPSNDLNFYIIKLDTLFADFLLENFALIHRTRNRQLFLDFKHHTDSIFADIENPYFRSYYEYKFASYLRIGNLERFDNLARNYIFNQPVLYENTQYMNFFHTVFDSYIFAGSRNISITDLRYAVNTLNSYTALMDSLGKDTLLRNEVLRELVMIKALQDMFNNPDYRQDHVRNLLNRLADESKFHQHRIIASNTLKKLEHLKTGSPAPQLTLNPGTDNEINVNKDFRGKFVLVEFWTSWCETCQLDKIAMQELYDKYRNDFEFVSVSTDRHKEAFQNYLSQNPEPWLNLHFGKDFRLLDTYGVKSIPLFLIIDPDGNIANYPAKRPGDNLALTFDRLLFERRRHQRNQ